MKYEVEHVQMVAFGHRSSVDAIREHRAFSNFKALKSSIFVAIAREDFSTLKVRIREWQLLCDSAENFLYEAVILMNPLAQAVATKKSNVIQHLVHNLGMRLKPFHEKECPCRLCITLESDLRFLQQYLVTVVVSAASPWYVFCANCDTVIETMIAFSHRLKHYDSLVKHGPGQEVFRNVEKTLILALECASNEREAIQLLQDLSNKKASPVDNRLRNILRFVDLEMKQVVEHPTVQSVLLHEWTGGAKVYRGKMAFLLKDNILGTFITGPFLYFIVVPFVLLFPHPKLVEYLERPSVRFQTKFISFIFLYAVAISTSIFTYLDVFLICKRRSGSPELHRISMWQGFLAVLIVGKMIKIVSGIHHTGKMLIVGMYDVLYLSSINFLVAGTTMFLIAIFIIPEREDVIEACNNSIMKIPNITQLGFDCTVTNDIYKKYPHTLSVFNTIAEPYIIGSILNGCCFLLYLVSVGGFLYNFKPVALFAITVEVLVKDVAKWILFFLFFMLGWCFAFKTVYSNFICNTTFFNNISNTLTELFWIMFAMSGTKDYQLNNVVADRDLWSKTVIHTMGAIIYMGFFIVGTLILVNLLIALMSASYEQLNNRKEQEIHFWRSKMMIKFIIWNDSLPLPWNLFFPLFILTRTIWRNLVNRHRDVRLFHSYAFTRIPIENKKREKEQEIINERIHNIFNQLIKENKGKGTYQERF